MTSTLENEHFLREEAEKLHRLASEKNKFISAEQAAANKALHHMKCPKCGDELHTLNLRGITIEKCANCGVTVLDEGELEALAKRDDSASFMNQLAAAFKLR